jgi:hypothetical protein
MPQRVIFSIEARADLRAIDRETALRLLKGLARFLATGTGNEASTHLNTAFASAPGDSSFANPAMTPLKLSASATGERPIGNLFSGVLRPVDNGRALV